MDKTGFLTGDIFNSGDNETLSCMVWGNNVMCHWSRQMSLYNDLTEEDCNSDMKYFAVL